MIGKRKRFDKALHDAHDPKSRKIVKDFFKRKYNVILTDNPNKRKTDLIKENGHLVEVEHRMVWKEYGFPYDTINFLERKAHHFQNTPFDYVILSCNYSRIGIIEEKVLKKYLTDEYLVESPNKYVYSGEYVYKIPIAEFQFHDVTENS